MLSKEQYRIDKTKCFDYNFGFNICDIAGRPSNQNGENNSRAKINEETAIHIKYDLSEGISIKDIQDKYNVNYQLVVNIRNLLAWKDIVSELNDKIRSFCKSKKPSNKPRCKKCGKVFVKNSNSQKYCKSCAKNK